MNRFQRPLLWLASLYLLLLAALWWMEHSFAELHWLLTTIAWAPQYPWLLGALVLFGLSIAARSAKAALISLAGALFAATVLMGAAFAGSPEVGMGSGIRVVTLNAGTGKTSQADLHELIRGVGPDVVCLQEAARTLGDAEDGSSLGGDLAEFQIVRDHDLAILSRLPVVARQLHDLGSGTRRSVLEVRVSTGEHEVTVLTTHFFRGRARETAGRLRRALADLTRSGKIHALQTERLMEIAAAAPTPQVIAGDLNLPPRGRLYRQLTRYHVDAFRAGGRGYGYSFPASLPMLRIDYVLTGPELAVHRCRTLSTGGSDHRAVVADLALPVPS